MINFLFKKEESDEYMPLDQVDKQLKMNFFRGVSDQFFIKFEIEPIGTVVTLEDVALSMVAVFGDVEYKFIKESSETNNVFVSNTKNEKRALISIDYKGVTLVPDDNGNFYLEEALALPGSVEVTVNVVVEPGFTKTFSEKSSLTEFAPELTTSTEV